jgi:ABC-2 type transport system ATP-binding protein
MIHVEQLSKTYGAVEAISDVSFTVEAGAVVGLLGPNGAGKTTTMRILCGCIGASAGSARIGGQDVALAPAEVKAAIGYLPETPPLYGHMVVRDFIRFAATIKGVEDADAATEAVIKTVGLDQDVGGQPAAGRIISHLSKGYQQRVGLAQALVHSPAVLVLDEPTSGLDPAQRRELRELLQQLARAQNRTVILSTHVLAEVEAICDEVVIISDGRVVAQDRIEALRGTGSMIRLRVGQPSDTLIAAIEAIDHVEHVLSEGEGQLQLTVTADVRAEVARAAAPHDLLELSQSEGLEDIYLRLTGGQP